jgi:hypothetical protein
VEQLEQRGVSPLTALDFNDLAPREEVVRIAGATYVLREASEGAVVQWKNSHLRSTRMTDGKITSFGDMADSEPLLVHLCLYVPGLDGKIRLRDGQPDDSTRVPLSRVRSWPARVVKPIFERAKAISELEEKETQEALEKQFGIVAGKLLALGNNEEERKLWQDWMAGEVREKMGATLEQQAEAEGLVKNGRSATPPSS